MRKIIDFFTDTIADVAYGARKLAGEQPSDLDNLGALYQGCSMRQYYRNCRQQQRTNEREEADYEKAERARLRRLARG